MKQLLKKLGLISTGDDWLDVYLSLRRTCLILALFILIILTIAIIFKINKKEMTDQICIKIKMSQIKDVVELGKKSLPELRKLNEYPSYNGKELTKEQLIYQIAFRADAPKPNF